jgi:carboxylesterase
MPAVIAAAIAALIVLVAVGLANTLPWFYRPKKAYALPDPARVRWPEALPLTSFKGNDRLLFCVHGFPSTPADFRKLEKLSNDRGWDMYAPLLPGCGTAWEDILDTGWEQYLAFISDRWRELRPRYRYACMVGASLGGSLALALAEELAEKAEEPAQKAEEPAQKAEEPAGGPYGEGGAGLGAAAGEGSGAKLRGPDALATIGSPAVLNALLRHGLVRSPLIYLARFMGAFIPSMGAGYPDPERVGEDGDGDWKGYLGAYPRQTYTLQLGLRAMERRLPLVRCPVFISHARGDRIVPFANAGILARGLGSELVERYDADMSGFNHAQHNLLLYDSQRERVWARILDFFERALAPSRPSS